MNGTLRNLLNASTYSSIRHQTIWSILSFIPFVQADGRKDRHDEASSHFPRFCKI